MHEYSIGVDLGGTNLRAAAVRKDGSLVERVSVATDVHAGRNKVVGDMVAAIQQVRDKMGPDGLAGVGIGVPGFIRIKEGTIVGAANLPGFENFPVRDEVSGKIGSSVILENDANAAALGEHWIGAGRGCDDLILITLGTGIGGGIISGGKILRGQDGMAAELGHMSIFPAGNPCGCGNQGCLEKHASATSVESMANLLSLGDHLDTKQVNDLARAGNAGAQRVFAAMGTALGIGLASLINIFNFPLYLLSGGVLPAWDFFAPAMFAEVERRSFTYRNTKTRIEAAKLGSEAGLYGAAYLPFLEKTS